jgi:hypothetical protein
MDEDAWWDQYLSSPARREQIRAWAEGLLLECKKTFDAGEADRGAVVLDAISLCFRHRLPVPPWAQKEFDRVYSLGITGNLSSWDKGFGRPVTKAKHERWVRDDELSEIVFAAVQKASLKRHRAIDDELFEGIGKKLGCGKTRVKDLYALARQGRKIP